MTKHQQRRRARARQRRKQATTWRRSLELGPTVPISTLQLQHEIERIRENADINASSHRFSPPPAA